MLEIIGIKDAEVAEEVWALQHAAYRVEATLIGVADLPPLQDTVESLRQSRETFCAIRGPEGDLQGVIAYEQEREGRYVICRVMVNPDHFRQGVGSRLLSHLLDVFPGAHWSVTAEARNLPALALYEKAGFKRLGAFRPAPGITLIRLERGVSPS
ncbi:GNAT family N-acetyltransferase [Cohnella panacarvi]|uniref:GNAT family N-acetyltransferase n=1 Tax=Cohnella panacarvi TaxID=400776 RepID=UPI0004797D70|nr:GNAT family N-acetyltransferase [Cohnella panacarvi]